MLHVYLSLSPSRLRLPDCLLACLPACLPARLPVCLSVCLPACLPVCLPACLLWSHIHSPEQVLKAGGCKPSDLTKVTVFLSDIGDFGRTHPRQYTLPPLSPCVCARALCACAFSLCLCVLCVARAFSLCLCVLCVSARVLSVFVRSLCVSARSRARVCVCVFCPPPTPTAPSLSPSLCHICIFGAGMNNVYKQHFVDAGFTPPARSAFAVAALPLGALVEIEAVASIP